jgi:hypothetical protein
MRVLFVVVIVALVLGMLLGVTGGARSASSASPVSSPDGVSASALVAFDEPQATGSLTQPVVFSTAFHSDRAPERVELLTRLPGDATEFVRQAAVDRTGDGSWTASVGERGFTSPNTTREYRFRAIVDGQEVLGPTGMFTVEDDRFDWRTMTDEMVTLHWYTGDEDFARRALGIGVDAIHQAADLLGVQEVAPVDFFVYDSSDALYGALGPGTRENVGGQADAAIRTMVGAIGPQEVDSDWVDTLVTHELTHMVFADATDDPYHDPPRWLNEGLAVYLSEGYAVGDRAQVADAAGSGRLIPLSGLAGLFPTTYERFSLAYAESVSAVSWFIDTYGRDTLVRLITSYRDGVTDEEAFQAATGAGFRAFDDAWIAAQGATRPEPYGPQPAPPGPVPAGWATAEPSLAASTAP